MEEGLFCRWTCFITTITTITIMTTVVTIISTAIIIIATIIFTIITITFTIVKLQNIWIIFRSSVEHQLASNVTGAAVRSVDGAVSR